MRDIIVAIGLVVCSAGVAAEEGRVTNGNDLLIACKDFINAEVDSSAERFNMGYCAGMVPAVGNTFAIFQVVKPEAAIVCLPKQQFTQGQAIRVVIKYLENHPERLHEDPMKLTVLAYMNAYPCKAN